MTNDQELNLRLGWVGTGRMGFELAARLGRAGCDLAVYNRTRAKAEPLTEFGASLVDRPADLADRDIVFTMVGGSEDFRDVTLGPDGILSSTSVAPQVIVDSTTISAEASEDVRKTAEARGVRLLAAPVSGNPKVARTGRLTLVVSGPPDAWEQVSPYLQLLGRGATYVGEGDRARLVKICHNLMLAIVAQSLAEITVLAEKGGVSRANFLSFLNDSVMGSTFTRYKTPAFVNLDFTPTFTNHLLLKDLNLGLDAGGRLGVPLPLSASVAQLVQALIGTGHGDQDFATLLELEAQASGLELEPEDVEVADGLSDIGRVRDHVSEEVR